MNVTLIHFNTIFFNFNTHVALLVIVQPMHLDISKRDQKEIIVTKIKKMRITLS